MANATQHNMMDYEKEYADFSWDVPEYYNFAGDVIDMWAEDQDKLAMLWVDDMGNEIKDCFWVLSYCTSFSFRRNGGCPQKGVKSCCHQFL